MPPSWRLAEQLRAALGERLTAYALGLPDPKAVGRIARGESIPRPETARRLWDLYALTEDLMRCKLAATVRAWLIGSNPSLDGRAPIELLHSESCAATSRASARAFQAVVSAARTDGPRFSRPEGRLGAQASEPACR